MKLDINVAQKPFKTAFGIKNLTKNPCIEQKVCYLVCEM